MIWRISNMQQQSTYVPPVDDLLSYIEGQKPKPRADAPSDQSRSSKAEKRARKKEEERLQKLLAAKFRESDTGHLSANGMDDPTVDSDTSCTNQELPALQLDQPTSAPAATSTANKKRKSKRASSGLANGQAGEDALTNKAGKDGTPGLDDIFAPKEGPINDDFDREVEELKRFLASSTLSEVPKERKKIAVNLNFSSAFKAKNKGRV